MDDFSNIADGTKREIHNNQRGTRRAIATNAVQSARFHAGRSDEQWTQSDADILVAIMELLDKVAAVE